MPRRRAAAWLGKYGTGVEMPSLHVTVTLLLDVAKAAALASSTIQAERIAFLRCFAVCCLCCLIFHIFFYLFIFWFSSSRRFARVVVIIVAVIVVGG